MQTVPGSSGRAWAEPMMFPWQFYGAIAGLVTILIGILMALSEG